MAISKLEQYIVKNLVLNSGFAINYLSKLDPKFFESGCEDIIKGIHAFYKRNNRAPSFPIIQDILIPKMFPKPEDESKRQSLIELTDNIQMINIPTNDQKIIEEETQGFIKRNVYIQAIMTGVELVEAKKFDEIVDIFDKAYEKLSFNDDYGLDYFRDLEARMERTGTLNESISTTYPSLDTLVGGGYRRKSIFIYAGPANIGKTLVLNDSALNMTLAGYNVLYFSLELAQDYLGQRTDAKYAQVAMNKINEDPEAALKKAITRRDQEAPSSKKGSLIYKYYGPNTVSSKNIENKMGIKFDFIFVDYLKLIKPNGKLYADNMYGKLEAVTQELRGMACELDVCVVTASQTNRESYNSNSIGMENLSDSLGIAQTADVIVTLARNEAINQDDCILMNIAKSRFSRNQGQIMMKVDYDYMRLVDTNEKGGTYKAKPKPQPKPKTKVVADQKDEDDFTGNGSEKVEIKEIVKKAAKNDDEEFGQSI